MKIKGIMEAVEKINEVRNAMEESEATVSLYVNNELIAEECTGFGPLDALFREEYKDEFVDACYDIDLMKTYNHTLACDLVLDNTYYKVELFIDC